MINESRNKIILALDVDTEKEAISLVKQLRGHVGIFKIGLELLNSVGFNVVREVMRLGGQVFLDGKFNDIPNTVAAASRAVTRLGVSMFNLHTMGGLEMMTSAVKAVEEESFKLGTKRPLILGVTILTSIDQVTLNGQLRISGDVETQVTHLARLADQAGADGVIASPHEIEAIRKNTSSRMLIVTPGVRPSWAQVQDQKRVMTPNEAILKGATYLVIGRPITKPPPEIGTPVGAAELIVEEIANALEKRGN